jgi:hypothetical protein
MIPDLKLFWLFISRNRPKTNTHRNVDIELNYKGNRGIKDGKTTKPWYAFVSPSKLITYFYPPITTVIHLVPEKIIVLHLGHLLKETVSNLKRLDKVMALVCFS